MIEDNVRWVQDEIAEICSRVGRDPAEVTLVAISKKKPVEDVLTAVQAGLRHFGENRVEEAQNKIPEIQARTDTPLTWHMVGHVQSRKATQVIELFDRVHSVDSVKLAEKLSRLIVEQREKTLDVLLQINVSGEETKSGLEAYGWEGSLEIRDRLWSEVQQIAALPGLRVNGLMTMAPIVDDMQETRPVFAGLAELREALSQSLGLYLPELSMGMTDDYPVAIEEGATLVRIGRAIFGERT